jgi:hypothetical protein
MPHNSRQSSGKAHTYFVLLGHSIVQAAIRSSGQQCSVLLCGGVSLSYAAIFLLHIFGFLAYLLLPVEKVPELQKVVNTKR